MNPLRTLVCLLISTPFGLALPSNTWIIDDDGGPGVDFLNVSDAVAAASHGDTLLVHQGFYPENFSTVKGLTIQGADPNVSISGLWTWVGLGAPRRVVLRDLEMEVVVLDNCAGTILMEASSLARLSVSACSDVRVYDCLLGGGSPVLFDASRAELVDCRLEGRWGYDGGYCQAGDDGEDALWVQNGSSVYLARSTVRGGKGGDTLSQCGDFGGNGGDAVQVDASSELNISGLPGDYVIGGDAGSGLGVGDDGIGGNGIVNDGFVRYSGVTILPGTSADFIDGQAIVNNGILETPATPDPVMVPNGSVTPGGVVTLTVHGDPGSTVRMLIGRNPEWVLSPSIVWPRLVDALRVVPIGNVGGNGTRVYNFSLPGNLPLGSLLIVQARLTDAMGTRQTHSLSLIVE